MGILEQLKAHALYVERWEFKDAQDKTVGSMQLLEPGAPPPDDIEIERGPLLDILVQTTQNEVTYLFNNSITALHETADHITATFKDGRQETFDLVLGCDGSHSGVRKIWFGEEQAYAHFMQHYFSLTIVPKLLIPPNTMHMFNVPGKVIMLNAYNNKTDVSFCFFSEQELPFHYRDSAQQEAIVRGQFAGEGWRTAELLEEVTKAGTAYFDKFWQVKMPSWTKGRVALVGDAAYGASPAAGMGGSLAIMGAAALADAMEKHPGDLATAFQEYDAGLRPFINEVQAEANNMLSNYLIPKTPEAIAIRNEMKQPV